MPKDITGVPDPDGNLTLTFTVPVAGDRTSASRFETIIQALANNDATLDGKFTAANLRALLTTLTAWIPERAIADDTIPESKLDIHNAPSDGSILSYTSNGMEWINQAQNNVAAGVESITGGAGITASPSTGFVTISITTNGINTAQLADDSVTSTKIVDGSITSAKIANNAVTTAKINDGAVTTAKIPDDAINISKMDFTNSGVSGQVVSRASSNRLTWLDVIGSIEVVQWTPTLNPATVTDFDIIFGNDARCYKAGQLVIASAKVWIRRAQTASSANWASVQFTLDLPSGSTANNTVGIYGPTHGQGISFGANTMHGNFPATINDTFVGGSVVIENNKLKIDVSKRTPANAFQLAGDFSISYLQLT